ncbi:heme-binding domain-containing protein [soil metagenome]
MKTFFRKILAKKKQILISILVILVVIQFIRPEKNSGSADGPNDITQFTTVSPEVKKILEVSCYDCHSNHTVYPWYSNVQPVAWWLNDHVNEGKGEVNFSEFKSYRVKRQMRKFHEIAKQIEEEEMPLNSYLWIHGNAKLDASQAKLLLDWAKENENLMIKMYPDSVQKG